MQQGPDGLCTNLTISLTLDQTARCKGELTNGLLRACVHMPDIAASDDHFISNPVALCCMLSGSVGTCRRAAICSARGADCQYTAGPAVVQFSNLTGTRAGMQAVCFQGLGLSMNP